MATIHTDSSQRGSQFDGRIMDVARIPDGTFALAKPIRWRRCRSRDDQDLQRHRQLTLHGRPGR